MQMINTGINQGDSTKLTEFAALLNEVAVPKYFSEVELEDNLNDSIGAYALVKFYLNDALCMTFLERKTANRDGRVQIILPDTEYAVNGTGTVRIGSGLLVTDNALVFFGYTDNMCYAYPLIVCKTTDDKTMCMYTGSLTSMASKQSAASVTLGSNYLVQHVFGQPAILDNAYDWFAGVSYNTDGVTVAAAMPTMDGHIANGVYHALRRSPYSIEYPFMYTQNGESYCGIAYNNYVIKTT